MLSPSRTVEVHVLIATVHESWALVSEYAKIRAAKQSGSEFILNVGICLLVSKRILVLTTTAGAGNN
jgi:hypothetical protein